MFTITLHCLFLFYKKKEGVQSAKISNCGWPWNRIFLIYYLPWKWLSTFKKLRDNIFWLWQRAFIFLIFLFSYIVIPYLFTLKNTLWDSSITIFFFLFSFKSVSSEVNCFRTNVFPLCGMCQTLSKNCKAMEAVAVL